MADLFDSTKLMKKLKAQGVKPHEVHKLMGTKPTTTVKKHTRKVGNKVLKISTHVRKTPANTAVHNQLKTRKKVQGFLKKAGEHKALIPHKPNHVIPHNAHPPAHHTPQHPGPTKSNVPALYHPPKQTTTHKPPVVHNHYKKNGVAPHKPSAATHTSAPPKRKSRIGRALAGALWRGGKKLVKHLWTHKKIRSKVHTINDRLKHDWGRLQ